MSSTLKAIGSWFRKVYEAIKRFEEAQDFRYEGYAQVRFAKIEQRLGDLEKRQQS
jgi:hypothetical protein